MSDDIFTDEDWSEAKRAQSLGPHYFAARRVCAEVVEKFDPEMLKPVVKKVTDDISDKLWDMIRDGIFEDTEWNLQSKVDGMVDEMVKAIVGGNDWALKKYVLGERHNCQQVRESIAKLIPRELQDKRVSDLEAQIAQLKTRLEWASQ